MPPAWENDQSLPAPIRAMLEFFSLYEEKNDGPAALIFSDGDVVGARLDRLGLRPLRTVETDDYLIVASEAGQVPLPADTVVHRGRIEAGGMLYLDHRTGQILRHPGGAGGARGPARLRRLCWTRPASRWMPCPPRPSPAAPAPWATTAT